jgi:hypothetical protein
VIVNQYRRPSVGILSSTVFCTNVEERDCSHQNPFSSGDSEMTIVISFQIWIDTQSLITIFKDGTPTTLRSSGTVRWRGMLNNAKIQRRFVSKYFMPHTNQEPELGTHSIFGSFGKNN